MADDFMGLYEKLVNGVYANYLPYMRKEAEASLFQMYDDIFKTPLQDIFPRTVASLPDGRVATVNDIVPVDYSVDPQTMAARMDRGERVRPKNVGFARFNMQAQLYKEAGPTMDPFEFEQEVKPGFLARRNQMLIANSIRAIERRIEYELVQYSRIEQSIMDRYGNQYSALADRNKKVDAVADPNWSAAWDDTLNADPMADISYINMLTQEMSGKDLTRGFIGTRTALGLKSNAKIKELVKYHYDLVSGNIAATIQGVTLTTVSGQTYKDNSSNRISNLQFGNLSLNGYSNPVVKRMMVDSSDKEWAIFTTGIVGTTQTVKTHQGHDNPLIPYGHTWQDPELEYQYSSLQFGFFPFVMDPADIVIVNNIASA